MRTRRLPSSSSSCVSGLLYRAGAGPGLSSPWFPQEISAGGGSDPTTLLPHVKQKPHWRSRSRLCFTCGCGRRRHVAAIFARRRAADSSPARRRHRPRPLHRRPARRCPPRQRAGRRSGRGDVVGWAAADPVRLQPRRSGRAGRRCRRHPRPPRLDRPGGNGARHRGRRPRRRPRSGSGARLDRGTRPGVAGAGRPARRRPRRCRHRATWPGGARHRSPDQPADHARLGRIRRPGLRESTRSASSSPSTTTST